DYFQEYELLKVLSSFIIIPIFFIVIISTILNKRFNVIIFVIIIYFLWRSLTSYFYSDNVLDLTNSVKVITLALFINITIKKYTRSILFSLSILFSIYIYINFMSIYLFPNGLYIVDRPSSGTTVGWFLGIANQFAYVIIPGLTFIILNAYYKYRKINILTWITIIISLLSLIKVWTATGIVSIFFIILLSIYISFRPNPKYTNFYMFSYIYIFIYLMIFNLEKIPPIKIIVVDLLQKDLTLSFRTVIWEKALSVIESSLIFGHGINTYVLAGEVTSFAAHNLLLQIILDSGIVGVTLILIIILISGRQLQYNRSRAISYIILSGVFAILVGGLAESYHITYLLVLLIFGYNVNAIINNFDRNVGSKIYSNT